jgi:hypothetical protein
MWWSSTYACWSTNVAQHAYIWWTMHILYIYDICAVRVVTAAKQYRVLVLIFSGIYDGIRKGISRAVEELSVSTKNNGLKFKFCLLIRRMQPYTVTTCRSANIATDSMQFKQSKDLQPVRLAGGWWLVLVCSERRVLLAGCGWLLVAGSFWEKSTAGWWLISRANRLLNVAIEFQTGRPALARP